MQLNDIMKFVNIKVFVIKPNFVSKKDQMTSRLKQSILFETGKVLTIKDISKKYHVSEFTVRRMIKLISPKSIHVIDRYHFIRQVLWGFENV